MRLKTEKQQFFSERAGLHRDRVKPWKYVEARRMRKEPTPAEAALWDAVRSDRLGARFRRQTVILGYIVDLWCPKWRIAVEADGQYHDEQAEYDRHRDAALAAIDIRVLRFPNQQLLNDMPSVLAAIRGAVR